MGAQMLRGSGMLASRLYGNLFELPPHQRLTDLKIAAVLELVPESVARENCVLPVDDDGETITFVTANDTDIMLQDKLRFILNRNVRFIARDRDEILDAINFFYGQSEGECADSMLQEFTDTAIDFTETAALDEPDLLQAFGGRRQVRQPAARSRGRHASKSKNSSPSEPHAGRNGLMFYTVPEGKRVVAHRFDGKIDILDGPKRVWKGLTRFEPMKHFVAHPGQYLSIRFRDGGEETVMGPTELWQDPRQHESITVNDCLDLAAKEAVVVYGPAEETEQGRAGTSRRIVYGPGQFAPNPGEWLHRFSWHASHGGSRGEEKRPERAAVSQTLVNARPDVSRRP